MRPGVKLLIILFLTLIFPLSELAGNQWDLSVKVRIKNKGKVKFKKVELENYTSRVIMGEIPSKWPTETLKAQAVAARTYAVYKKFKAQRKDFDLRASVLDQEYKDKGEIPSSIARAVKETRGVILTLNHFPAPVFYHSCCGGRTAEGNQAFRNIKKGLLPSVSCPYDEPCRKPWKFKISTASFKNKINYRGSIGRIFLRKNSRGRVSKIILAQRTYSLSDFRQRLGYFKLKSDQFKVQRKENFLYFEGKGFGHGVGMCQWGARGLAKQKKYNWKRILKHYFPNYKVMKLYD